MRVFLATIASPRDPRSIESDRAEIALKNQSFARNVTGIDHD